MNEKTSVATAAIGSPGYLPASPGDQPGFMVINPPYFIGPERNSASYRRCRTITLPYYNMVL